MCLQPKYYGSVYCCLRICPDIKAELITFFTNCKITEKPLRRTTDDKCWNALLLVVFSLSVLYDHVINTVEGKEMLDFCVGFDSNCRDKINRWESQLWFYEDQLKPFLFFKSTEHQISVSLKEHFRTIHHTFKCSGKSSVGLDGHPLVYSSVFQRCTHALQFVMASSQ